MAAYGWSKRKALLTFNVGTRTWVVSFMLRPLCSWGWRPRCYIDGSLDVVQSRSRRGGAKNRAPPGNLTLIVQLPSSYFHTLSVSLFAQVVVAPGELTGQDKLPCDYGGWRRTVTFLRSLAVGYMSAVSTKYSPRNWACRHVRNCSFEDDVDVNR
jgi:hypothetical protein